MVAPVLTQTTFFYWTDEVRTCIRKQRHVRTQSTDATYPRQSMPQLNVRNADGGRETTPATSITSRHCGKHATVHRYNVQGHCARVMCNGTVHCALCTRYCIAAADRKDEWFWWITRRSITTKQTTPWSTR